MIRPAVASTRLQGRAPDWSPEAPIRWCLWVIAVTRHLAGTRP